jgi:hypothetical protein
MLNAKPRQGKWYLQDIDFVCGRLNCFSRRFDLMMMMMMMMMIIYLTANGLSPGGSGNACT